MEGTDPILGRRSIRTYKDKKISSEDLEYILSAASAAPSAMGKRSWHFVVIDKRDILDRIPNIHPYSKMVKEAPMVILVCGDTGREKNEGYMAQNCSAAIQNILIAATKRGLGSVWLGIYPRRKRIEDVRHLFDVPEHLIPFSFAVIGHPAEEKKPYTGYRDDEVTFNGW